MTEQVKTKPEPVSLKSLMTPSKTVSIEYPGYEGFNVDLTYLGREELLKLRNEFFKLCCLESQNNLNSWLEFTRKL